MAIVVEREEKNNSLIINILIWGIIIVVIGVAFYYIFFKRPELVEIAVPVQFRETEELSRIRLSPDEIVRNPTFQLLRPYITPLAPEEGGKANPFLRGSAQ